MNFKKVFTTVCLILFFAHGFSSTVSFHNRIKSGSACSDNEKLYQADAFITVQSQNSNYKDITLTKLALSQSSGPIDVLAPQFKVLLKISYMCKRSGYGHGGEGIPVTCASKAGNEIFSSTAGDKNYDFVISGDEDRFTCVEGGNG